QIVDRNPPTPVSQVVWTPQVLQILAEARPERGRAKVKEVCAACHGEQGVSASAEFPNLAGQSGTAIYKQLNDYHTGSRTNQFMTDVAKALDETAIADVAAYYAGQPMRNPRSSTLADAPEAIRTGTYRRAPPVIGKAPAGQSTHRSSLSNGRNTWPPSSRCSRPDSGAMMSTGGCVPSPQS